MNRTNIDWPNLTYTWNPVVGCKYNCSYCYAKKLHNKRHEAYKKGAKLPAQYAKPYDVIQFFPERLKEPYKVKKPSTIFVGSMCDLFGEWVDMEWIYDIITVADENPHHTFMFLTKNDVGYNGFCFPDNCLLGLTLTKGDQDKVNDFFYYSSGKRFLSIEPLLGSFEGINLSCVDLVIVGAMTGKNPVIPKREWIESIKHPNVYYKENIRKYLK